jgi:hypothetical protein
MAGMIGLLHERRDWRTLLARLGVWLVPVVVGVWVVRHGQGLKMGHVGRLAWRRVTVATSLEELHWYLLDVFVTDEDDLITVLLVALFVVLRLTAPRRRPTLHELRAFGCFLVPAVAYFVLPRSLLAPSYWWGVNVRFAVPAALFGALCVPGPVEGRRRWVMAPVALAALAFAVATSWHWRRADAFFGARAFDRLAAMPPPGARVLVLTYPPINEPSLRQNYAQSYPALFQAFHGGYYPTNFDEGFPLVYKERFPAPGFRNPERFRWDYQARYYDYVLVYRSMHFGEGQAADLVATEEPWSLWKLRGARIDVPPAPAYPRGWVDDPDWRPGKPIH